MERMRSRWGGFVTRPLRRSGAPPGGYKSPCQELADAAYQKALRKRGPVRKMPPVERRQALISDRKEIGRTVRSPTARCANAREPVIANDTGALDGAPLPFWGRRKRKRKTGDARAGIKQQGRRSVGFDNEARSPDERSREIRDPASPPRKAPRIALRAYRGNGRHDGPHRAPKPPLVTLISATRVVCQSR
jgi:hypothetical protein